MSARRHRHGTMSMAVLVMAAIGFVQVRAAAAASQDLSSIDKVQTWLAELGVEQSVRDNFRKENIDLTALSSLTART